VRHTLVTMTRGDAHKIAEWVDHHARLGFSDLQIVLDGDVDGTGQVLEALADEVPARITLHRRAEQGEYFDGLAPAERHERVRAWREQYADPLASGEMRGVDPLAWRQHQHIAELMTPYAAGRRGVGWLAFFDVDEFLVLRGHRSVGELLREVRAPRARFHSFDVDTTGHDPARPVLDQHTWRWGWEDLASHPQPRWARRVKSIVRYRAAVLSSTVHKISRGRHELVDWPVARLHHFKVPPSTDVGIPYSVQDPVRRPSPG
jgi:hypothetical protein